MAGKSSLILCTACGEESLLRREPVYEDFRKTGERLSCASCGHEFASEEDVPYKRAGGPSVFAEEDRPKALRIFDEEEETRNCRRCRHYVVNPFTQRCGLRQKTVDATDVCDSFDRAEPDSEQAQP